MRLTRGIPGPALAEPQNRSGRDSIPSEEVAVETITLSVGSMAGTQVQVVPHAVGGSPGRILLSIRREASPIWTESVILAFTADEARALVDGVNDALVGVLF